VEEVEESEVGEDAVSSIFCSLGETLARFLGVFFGVFLFGVFLGVFLFGVFFGVFLSLPLA